ncbi:MAG: lysylphosphatidylglycerol synthase transmembrane domain-containing protein [Sulfurisoma sp.]|nr:lysylphosphatidylglycerol synthase transmembrane domain-containing protein [Sulfurisoma sp.]
MLDSQPAPTRAIRLAAWTVALAAAGYLALSLWAGWREVAAAFVRAGVVVVVGMLALSLVNYLLRFARWQHYLTLLGHRVPWGPSARIYFAGFALTTTPGKMGELLRGVMLKPFGVPLVESTAAFFSERAADLLAILLLCAAVFWLYPNGAPLVAGALSFVAAVIVAVQFPGWIHAIDHWAQRRGGRWVALARLCELVLGFRTCFRWTTLSWALVLGVVAWGAEAVAFHWLLVALGHPLPLALSVFIYAFAMLVGGLSFLPGGLGGSEAVMVALLIANGLPQPVAVSATILCRLATLWFAVALGAIFLLRSR